MPYITWKEFLRIFHTSINFLFLFLSSFLPSTLLCITFLFSLPSTSLPSYHPTWHSISSFITLSISIDTLCPLPLPPPQYRTLRRDAEGLNEELEISSLDPKEAHSKFVARVNSFKQVRISYFAFDYTIKIVAVLIWFDILSHTIVIFFRLTAHPHPYDIFIKKKLPLI